MCNLTKIKGLIGKCRYVLIVEWYNFFWHLFSKKNIVVPHIASIEETIVKIVKDRCSVSRFGDGEVLLTLPYKDIGFQHGSVALSDKLTEVLTSNLPNHIVCLSDTFSDLKRYNRRTRRFWTCHFYLYDYLWARCLDPNKQYYNTFVSRLYSDFADKSKCGYWFKNVKRIWDGRDIIFIEGEKSRLGVGNDLFDNAKSIRRILGPASDGFERYNDLIELAKQFGTKDTLFLLALGPTATCLAYDLAKLGYQAMDIGHIDIEYEWWRMKAKRKVKVSHKFVNEAVGGNVVADEDDFDSKYKSQIIANVKDIPFKRPRTIAYCTPEIYLPGGIERVVSTKCNYFADNEGYDMYIILTDNPSQPPYYRLSEKVHVVQLDIRYEELWDANFFKKVFLYLKKQIKYKLLLRRYLYVIKPDISVSCMRREINFITSIHDGSKKIAELHINKSNLRRFDTSPYDSGPSLLYNKIIPRLWNRNLIYKLRKLSKFITLSEEDAQHWKELDNVVVIPDPIPFMPEKVSDCSAKRVIAVGRYVPQKGFDILLNIWKKIEDKFPDWELCIYGPGEVDFYKKVASDLNLKHCTLTGAITPEQVNQEFVKSSIQVLTSRYEGFGMVIIEAMACGLPSVSFACPSGPSDIITDGKDGYLIKSMNQDAFCSKLSSLMSNEDLRKEMGANARKTAEKYSIENISGRWIGLFDEVLRDKK